MEDKKIIALYLDRDTAAIERSSERYGAYCKSIARNILGCEQDAEECVNDTWLRAWNSIPPHAAGQFSRLSGKADPHRGDRPPAGNAPRKAGRFSLTRSTSLVSRKKNPKM